MFFDRCPHQLMNIWSRPYHNHKKTQAHRPHYVLHYIHVHNQSLYKSLPHLRQETGREAKTFYNINQVKENDNYIRNVCNYINPSAPFLLSIVHNLHEVNYKYFP